MSERWVSVADVAELTEEQLRADRRELTFRVDERDTLEEDVRRAEAKLRTAERDLRDAYRTRTRG